MGLDRTFRHRNRSALLSSLGGVAVIGAVVLVNGWSLLTAEPEHGPMAPLVRLGATGTLTTDTAAANAQAVLGAARTAGAEANRELAARTDAVAVKPDGSPAPEQTGKPSQTVRSWTIAPGDTLAGALARLFVYGQTQRDVLSAYAKVRDPGKLQAGWRIQGRFSSAGLMDASSLEAIVVAPPAGEGVTIQRDAQGDFVAEEGGLVGTLERQAVRCVLTGPLDDSLRRCGEGEGLAVLLQQVLRDRLKPGIAPQPGDELRVVVDRLMDGDHLVRYQRLLAIQVRSVRALGEGADATPEGAAADGAGRRWTAVWFEDDRQAGWYDLQGGSREPLLDLQPVQVGRFTSGFGRRLHPILHKMKAHQGVDYAAPRGTPVGAAGAGTVLTAHAAGPAGNLVRIRHDQGYVTEYMHLAKFASGLTAGKRVRKGQLIGYVGTTGRSTGPHLHFGLKHHGVYVDPVREPLQPQAGVGSKARAAFESARDEVLALLHALDNAGQRGS